MIKKFITEKELLAWLNEQLQKHEDGINCQFVSIVKLVELDEAGSNWSTTFLRCGGKPINMCSEIATAIICKAKQLYNIRN